MMATPTMATGLIRDATRKHPTTTAPMRMSHDCHGLDLWFATPKVYRGVATGPDAWASSADRDLTPLLAKTALRWSWTV